MKHLSREMCERLKDAGYPQGHDGWVYVPADGYSFCVPVRFMAAIDPATEPILNWTLHAMSEQYEQRYVQCPTLEELIQACGAQWDGVGKCEDNRFRALSPLRSITGTTPTEAVALLWLKLRERGEV